MAQGGQNDQERYAMMAENENPGDINVVELGANDYMHAVASRYQMDVSLRELRESQDERTVKEIQDGNQITPEQWHAFKSTDAVMAINDHLEDIQDKLIKKAIVEYVRETDT